MGDIEHQGSVGVDMKKRIRVGDVVRLPDNRRVIVKSINYGYTNATKIISFGSIDGNAYQAIKERVRLSELKYKEETEKKTPEKKFLYQSELTGRLQWMTYSRWRYLASNPFHHEKWQIIMQGAGFKRAQKANSTTHRNKTSKSKPKSASHTKASQAYNRKRRDMGLHDKGQYNK